MRVAAMTLGLIAGAHLLVSCGEAPAPVQPQPSESYRSPVTIDELVSAYRENEMAAQQEYGNKWLIVSGVVESVELDMFDEPIVYFEGDVIPNPNARFDVEAQYQTGDMMPGQNVSILCKDVSEFMGSPGLKGCSWPSGR